MVKLILSFFPYGSLLALMKHESNEPLANHESICFHKQQLIIVILVNS